MKNAKKRILPVDERGRITLPSELREGVESFSVESKGGQLVLMPLKTVLKADAELLESLKLSVAQSKSGDVEDFPAEWLD